ncbi:uncharacterized protein VP01_1076g1 [Puccinia sorghi]|uniref:Uncharacterized protein n=1 Tax=Puccinia sorghi TaxID=27349 RepID=A0A0L6VTH7_9BASI|nr:uncharacterized protein VP01_1076g1 [Puccinia sorghi]
MARCMLKQSGLPLSMRNFAHKLAFISSLVAQFLDYGSKNRLPVNNCDSKSDLSVNQISFELGKFPVEVICDEQDGMIEKIPQISDLDILKNLKHAKRSELWDWWKKACLEELNSLKEFDVWEE